MNKENFKLRKIYELKDNGSDRQDLFSKIYQGQIIISETEIGNINDILKKSEELQQENKELQSIIDKSIKCIESQKYEFSDGEIQGIDCSCDGFKLLSILKEKK